MPPYVNFFYLSYMTEKYWKVGAEKFKIKPTKPQACPSNVILACALVLMGFLPKLGLQNGIWTQAQWLIISAVEIGEKKVLQQTLFIVPFPYSYHLSQELCYFC